MEQREPSTRSKPRPAGSGRRTRWLALASPLVIALTGCGAPFLSPDGLLVFPEPGDDGAMVITANGVQYRDRRNIPRRVVYGDPFEPWRNPAGFIAPADGRFTQTSRPVVLINQGLVASVRASDELVPTWGGELLVRVDVTAPAVSGSLRTPLDLKLVLDGAGEDSAGLVSAALEHLGPDDRVTVYDGAGVVVPGLPGNHRSLVQASVERRMADVTAGRRRAADLDSALARAWRTEAATGSRRPLVVVLTDGACARTGCLRAQTAPPASIPTLAISTSETIGQELSWISSRIGALPGSGKSPPERALAVGSFVPPPGPVAFREVTVRFAGVPGPSHLIESSGGEIFWHMLADSLSLGPLRAGESRTEVVRLSVPSWTQTLPFELQVSVHAQPARSGVPMQVDAELQFPYDEDITRIARQRCGDVLAYGSALAWMNRLQHAFVGPGIDRAGGLYRLARMHQASMQALARDQQDRAALDQAVALGALLDAHPPW